MDSNVIEEVAENIPLVEKKKERKESEKRIRVRYIGLVTEVRKVQTKTGKMMTIARCDGINFQFSVVVFPKDYEIFGDSLKQDEICVVEGFFKGNADSGEISVMPTSVRSFSITTMRKQAQEMNLFDPKHRVQAERIAALLEAQKVPSEELTDDITLMRNTDNNVQEMDGLV